jgi:hypothetical protein
MPIADQLSQMSQMPQGGGGMEGGPQGPPMQGPPPGMQQGAQNALGGPGVDTPQEQKAVQMLMQGAMLFRQAAEIDPSVSPIVDKMLTDSYLQITKHYGFEQEGKMAIQQAQMQKSRMKSQAFNSPAGQQEGPPVGM